MAKVGLRVLDLPTDRPFGGIFSRVGSDIYYECVNGCNSLDALCEASFDTQHQSFVPNVSAAKVFRLSLLVATPRVAHSNLRTLELDENNAG